MNFFEVALLFGCFCLMWFGSNIVWKYIEGKMTVTLIERQMDAAYSKGIRLILRAVQEWKTFGKDVM